MAKYIKIVGAAGPKIQAELVKALIANKAMLSDTDGTVTCINHLHDSVEMNGGSMVFYKTNGTIKPFPKVSKVCRDYGLKCCFGDTAKAMDPAKVWPTKLCFLTVTDEEAIARNQKNVQPIRFITEDQLNDRLFWMGRTPEERQATAKAIQEGGEEGERLEKVAAIKAFMAERLNGKSLTQLKAMELHLLEIKP